MIRAIHPDLAQEGLVYANRLDQEKLDLARERGWHVTTVTAPPPDLPTDAESLWRAVAATDRPWVLNLREVECDEVDPPRTITDLRVQGLDPARPDRWQEWVWVGRSLNPFSRPRIPLYRAHELAAAVNR